MGIMTEPQVWVLIGVFVVAMFGVPGLVVPLINRATRNAIGELRGEMLGGFKAVDVKLDHLDRDVSALMRREFGTPD